MHRAQARQPLGRRKRRGKKKKIPQKRQRGLKTDTAENVEVRLQEK